ncbi:MAG TPA: hypothetical protein VGQ86_10435 [Candidatus Limnocylindria bacterium]|jgi:hypothetical protein|nr:hypothetical protein [Candidatus Limnocylindria bacterium]
MSEPEAVDERIEVDVADETEGDGDWLAEQVRLLDLEDGFAA